MSDKSWLAFEISLHDQCLLRSCVHIAQFTNVHFYDICLHKKKHTHTKQHIILRILWKRYNFIYYFKKKNMITNAVCSLHLVHKTDLDDDANDNYYIIDGYFFGLFICPCFIVNQFIDLFFNNMWFHLIFSMESSRLSFFVVADRCRCHFDVVATLFFESLNERKSGYFLKQTRH